MPELDPWPLAPTDTVAFTADEENEQILLNVPAGVFAPVIHAHMEYVPADALGDAAYANIGTSGLDVAAGNHAHDLIYALLGHTHEKSAITDLSNLGWNNDTKVLTVGASAVDPWDHLTVAAFGKTDTAIVQITTANSASTAGLVFTKDADPRWGIMATGSGTDDRLDFWNESGDPVFTLTQSLHSIGVFNTVLHDWNANYCGIEGQNAAIMMPRGGAAGGGIYMLDNIYYSDAWRLAAAGDAAVLGVSSGYLYFLQAAPGTADAAATLINQFVISDEGYFRVGNIPSPTSVKFDVYTEYGNNWAMRVQNVGASHGYGYAYGLNIVAGAGSQDYNLYCVDYDGRLLFSVRGDGATNIAWLGGTGTRTVVADAYGALSAPASDSRLKTKVERITDALPIIHKLRGVRFNWDTTQERVRNHGDQREIGMIAQEVEAIAPELVFEDKQGFKGVHYERLAALLLEGFNELAAKVEALNAH
jgi:hypothetical protein